MPWILNQSDSRLLLLQLLWLNIINARAIFGTRIEGRVWAGALLGLIGVAAVDEM